MGLKDTFFLLASPAGKAAKRGDPWGQTRVGDYYCYEKKDYYKALEWYRKAAEQGYPGALISLGLCYYHGYGVPKDYSQVVYWYRKAAEQGDSSGQFLLGECYLKGEGVVQDRNMAIEWLIKSAKLGHSRANEALLILGVNIELEKNRMLAQQGDSEGMLNMGIFYLHGSGVAKDYNLAFSWFSKAAEQGNAKAQCHLGDCYNNGYGVSIDESQSIYWYRVAARNGDERAQNILKFKGLS